MSILVATGRGDTVGVLFKNAESIETLRDVDVLVVDKTGTLTEGRPKLIDVVMWPAPKGREVAGEDGGASPEGPQAQSVGARTVEMLSLVAALESASEHPLAEAIVAGAVERGARRLQASDFDSVTGKGVQGTVMAAACADDPSSSWQVAIGNEALLTQLDIDHSSAAATVETLRAKGHTVMFVAINDELAALLSVADPVKETTPAALAELRDQGLRIVMLTGDSRTTAQAVANQLGIDEVHAEVLPEDKAEAVRQLQSEGSVVAMAGDGINDAPALALADIGIAMGTGTDVAMESAAVTLVRGDLRGIVRAIRLSRATMRNIRQNLAFAFGYNALGVPLAAGVLYPVTGLLLSPMVAAAAMSFSSVSVILNALRLRRVRLEGDRAP